MRSRHFSIFTGIDMLLGVRYFNNKHKITAYTNIRDCYGSGRFIKVMGFSTVCIDLSSHIMCDDGTISNLEDFPKETFGNYLLSSL